MMNKLGILLSLALFGCSQGERKAEDQTMKMDPSLAEQDATDTVGEVLAVPILLPEGFYLDTMETADKARKLTIFISRPVSGVKKMDKTVLDDIEAQKNNFIKDLDEIIKEEGDRMSTMGSDLHIEPVSVFKDDKVTSILFIISQYHGGAAHPMTMYYSFNFDNKLQKRIYFSDYFNVRSSADTTYVAGLITRAVGREGIVVTDLNEIDFNVEKDSIAFNFDDYEIASYAEGIIRAKLDRQTLNAKIKSNYR